MCRGRDSENAVGLAVSRGRCRAFLPCLLLLAGVFWLSGCRDGKAGKAGRVGGFQDLDSAEFTIGSMTGCVALEEARNALPHAHFMEYAMPVDAFAALCAGRVDAVALDRPTLEFMALSHPELAVMPEDLAVGHISVAAALADTALMERVNCFIRDYRADGTYRQMVDRWFHATGAIMPRLLPPEHPEGLLRVGVTADNEPLCFIQEGRLAGFDSEFAERLAIALNCGIEFVNMPYDALVIGLDSGRIDLAVAFMDAIPEREESVLFSKSYIDAPITFLLPRSFLKEESSVPRASSSVSDGASHCLSAWMKSLCGSFERTFLRESRWKLILEGTATTLAITFFAVILGTALAFLLCAMFRSRNALLSWAGERYVSAVMGTPVLIILMFLYYVVFAKIDIQGVLVAILAFAMDFSACASLALRAGIDAVPRGQSEAALALGHTPLAAFCRFVLPQAVRTVLPVYRGEVISTLKATSVVGYIAVLDLTKMGDIIRSRTYEAFFPLFAIALIYFFSGKCLTWLLLLLERSLDPEVRRNRRKRRARRC